MLGWLLSLFKLKGAAFAAEQFPPTPAWKPTIVQPLDQIIDRFRYYTDGKQDFAVFTHGTCAIVDAGLSDEAAAQQAKDILSKVFNFHPDMNPLDMDDGNILVQYNEPAFNVVLEQVAAANIDEIRSRYLDALARDEVIITAAGPNIFDDFGKKALWGRCYMFMDAQAPQVVSIQRKARN